jgi:uncharacterized membrane protein
VQIWKFLHIACMLGAFTVGLGGGVFAHRIVHGGDVAAIRRVLPAWDRLGNLVAIPLLAAGIAFGFVTAVVAGFDLTAPWLVLTYVLVAGLFVHGFLGYDPQLKRLKAAAAASPDDEPSPELAALIASRRIRYTFGFETLLWLAIIYTMVVKPFS